VNASKKRIRAEIGARRRALRPERVQIASQEIISNLLNHPAFLSAQTVALYRALPGEVDLDSLFSECWARKKATAIPLFDAEKGGYELVEVFPETAYRIGHYGIREPVSPAPLSIDKVDLMIVPGVAFDSSGNRLGRGGGYYDQFLALFSGTAVGVAFDFQVLPEIPLEPHDRPVNLVLSAPVK